jgi:ABC-type uncharacterized transport system ATPase subunit
VTPRLSTVNLAKRYGACAAVDGVSLDFAPGQIHAVVGENGAGKSTFLKLLFGLVQPTSGELHVDGKPVQFRSSMDAIKHGLGMVQQHFTLVETLSAIDNIMLGAEPCRPGGRLDRARAIARLEKTLPSPHLAVPWNARVGDLSVGQKQRIEILKLLFREARVLFLDEPTAVLTPHEIEDFFAVLRTLKAEGRTVVLITHKIGEVMRLCDTFAVLRAGRLVARGAVADTTAGKIVESMIGRPLPEFVSERPAPRLSRVLDVKNVSIERRAALKNVNLFVHAGEVVGIAGVEGSGQAELVEAALGLRPFAGEIYVMDSLVSDTSRKGVGLIPEDRLTQGLWLEESCFTNMIIGLEERFVHRGIFDESQIRSRTESWAKDFDVRAESLTVPVAALSGGNQQKVIFAREVSGRAPRFLICHQPTRGVDLGAIDLIHRKIMQLRNEGLGTLLISSELDELLKLCDRIYVLYEGQVSAEFPRSAFDAARIGAAMTGTTHA